MFRVHSGTFFLAPVLHLQLLYGRDKPMKGECHENIECKNATAHGNFGPRRNSVRRLLHERET